ncbi:MAG: ThuA domain-containing protein [Clostridiales bacterium]|nr:ThuA domain-containing protein [Clostridiales bacterium]
MTCELRHGASHIKLFEDEFMISEIFKNVLEKEGFGVEISDTLDSFLDAEKLKSLHLIIPIWTMGLPPRGDGVEYVVNVKSGSSPILEGIEDFMIKSEQYYVQHIDPAIEVLAATRFPVINWYHSSNGQLDVPVIWTKKWGLGRVFYSSLGHHADVVENGPAFETIRRGFLWAAEGKDLVMKQGVDTSKFEDKVHKMF